VLYACARVGDTQTTKPQVFDLRLRPKSG